MLNKNQIFGLGALILLSACSETDQFPVDTQVTIFPQEKSFVIGAPEDEALAFCYMTDGIYQDVPLLISVSNGEGSPLGDVEVGVYSDFAGNTFNGANVLQLYHDRNGNGVVDGVSELVNGDGSGVFKTKTHRYNGTAQLLLRMNLTCPYQGEVYAFVGPTGQSMAATVEYEQQASQDYIDGIGGRQ